MVGFTAVGNCPAKCQVIRSQLSSVKDSWKLALAFAKDAAVHLFTQSLACSELGMQNTRAATQINFLILQVHRLAIGGFEQPIGSWEWLHRAPWAAFVFLQISHHDLAKITLQINGMRVALGGLPIQDSWVGQRYLMNAWHVFFMLVSAWGKILIILEPLLPLKPRAVALNSQFLVQKTSVNRS